MLEKFLSCFLISFTLLVCFDSVSQTTHSIKVIAKYKKNAVTLRWAPTNPYVWQLGVKYGYTVERFTLSENGKWNESAATRPKPLSSTPIKPYSKETFDELLRNDEKAGVVQELIYGEEFNEDDFKENPVSILRKTQELENRFGLALFTCDLSQKVAIAAGLLWFDKSPSKGTRYAYRVKLAFVPEGVNVEPGVTVLDAGQEIPVPQVANIKSKFSDSTATISWPVFLYRGIYTAYYIERSSDGKNFKSLTDVPYVHATEKTEPENAYFVDSLPDNSKIYYYRIKGLTPFGEIGPPSIVIKGKGRKTLSGIVSIDSSHVIQNKKVYLSWSFPEEYKADIKGFYVTRSEKADGVYKEINSTLLPISQRTFIDEKPITYNYYRIKYLAKEGGENYFTFPYLVQLVDSVPPVIPVGLKGAIDSLGIATIIWTENQEPDLQGYRVFRANSLQEEFIEATNLILKKPKFTDTVNINTLTKDVYYQIVAVDRHFNPSEYSTPLKLKRPDKIAPVPPVFTKAERSNEAIELNWINSPSSDVAKYVLSRKEKESAEFKKLGEWGSLLNKENFVDSSALLGKTYIYEMKVEDSVGNSDKVLSKFVFFETGIREPVKNVKTSVDRKENKIILEWSYKHKEVSKCLIYRAKEGDPIKIYQTLSGDIGKFEDKQLLINNNYIYKIKLTLKGGIQTQLSEEIKVTY